MTYIVDGSDLWIQEGLLDQSEIDRIERVIRSQSGIDTIHLKNLTGGNSLLARLTLHSVFVFRYVEVHGLCESACAHLALTSRSPALHVGATLVIHDPPPFIDWIPVDSIRRNDVEWLRVRLPTVPKEIIARVLMAPWPRQRQLVLRPAPDWRGAITVSYRDPSPQRCVQLPTIPPGQAQVAVLPAP